MDIPDYNCSVHQEANKNDKLTNSYIMAVDSGYDSIYNGCASVLMEKSFSRESFEIFSPNSANRTPIKQQQSTSAAMKYRVSTPKSTTSHKRHLFRSSRTSTLKRSKSENEENEPKTANAITRYQPDHLNDSGCPLKPLHNNYDFTFTPHKTILSSTAKTSFSINDSSFFDSKQLKEIGEECNEQPMELFAPERPIKSQRCFKPMIKHSKRKLDIPPVDDREKSNRMYFNGTRFLNIIGKLSRFNEILDGIFKNLSSKDLLNVSLVSKNWNSIVKSNRNANARIKQYLHEYRNVKENIEEPIKPVIEYTKRHPFSQFNSMSSTKKSPQSISSPLEDIQFSENLNLVQHLFVNERLIKCPRCSRSSILSNSTVRLHSTSLIAESTTARDLKLLNKKADSICGLKSTDITMNNDDQSQVLEEFGICTGAACQYKFCPKCFCDFHPGKRCITSEPESPTKLLICHQKLKIKHKPNSKRQSLRRLCFS